MLTYNVCQKWDSCNLVQL